MKRKIAAILAADVEGYSRLVSEDEEEALRRLAVYRAVFDDFIVKAGGRVFNTAGDAVLAEFNSAVEATRCAIDVQESLRTRNLAYQPSRHMLFRIGITIGDVVEREGDLLGDGVNIAARLQTLAAPGGICISRSVHEQVVGKLSVPFRDVGELEVKNIAHPVHAFMVDMGAEAAQRDELRLRGSRARRPGFGSLALVLSAVGAAFGIAAFALALFGAWRVPPAQQRPRVARPFVPPTASPAEAFAILSKTGLLGNPKTAPEFYHNARIHEARGEPAEARHDYEEMAKLGTEAVDAFQRYAALIRGQENRARAREIFAVLAGKSRAAQLVFIMQHEPHERRRRLVAFVEANPEYGPAHFLLAREFSADRVGEQTLYDKRHEFDGLDRFLELDRAGKLTPSFMDASVLAEWRDRARRSHALLDALRQSMPSAPTAAFTRGDDGWSVSLNLPEAATEVSYRLDGKGDFVPTGSLPDIDRRSGKPVPKTTFGLPRHIGPTTLEVRYVDMSGHAQGPFPIRFDPMRALIKDQKEGLERFWRTWIVFRRGQTDADIVDFSRLITHRCTIAKAEFGFDEDPPTRTLPLPPCAEGDPQAVPAGAAATFPVPPGKSSLSIQLTYTDGTRSETRTFKRL